MDALEQTILQLAVRGLLVPQDPTDEPASVLLQKIRTEKDHLIALGKITRDKPLPPITEQSRIVTRVNELRSFCADLRQRLAALQSGQKQLATALIENANS